MLGVSAVVRRDGRVLLVRRGRMPLAGAWALPGGKVEAGERLAEAAAREVREETGIIIDQLRRIDLAEIIERDESGGLRSHHVVVVFEGNVQTGTLRAGDDAIEVRWATAADLDDMVLTEDTARVLSRLVGE
jgi:ADP-ribose pyrophosphatase YjhB (NUDIX family)